MSKSKQARKKSSQGAPQAILIHRLTPILVTGIFLLAIFLLPYHFPPTVPSNSQSWEFGYNNTVAQGLIALLLLSLFAWQFFFGNREAAQDPVARTVLPEDEPVSLRPLLATMGILQLLTSIVLLVWYSILPFSHYGEITYFIQRMEAMLLGRAPYVDFAFDYGPALLSMPIGIYHLFRGAISVEAAYVTTLIIHFIIGFAFVTYVISQISARGRVLILAMVGFQLANLTMGLNASPLRFTIALTSLFAIRHLHRATGEFSARRFALLGVAGFLLPLLNFAISPEMGLAVTVSICVYFFWFLFEGERRLALLGFAVLAGVGLAAIWFPRPYFNSIFAFGKGGASFPIFPTIHILGFLAAAIWVIPRLGIISVCDKSSVAPFCACLAVFCGLFILPATGRCDPGHIWSNSIGLMIITLAAISWLQPKWWYTLWGIYFVIFPLSNQIFFLGSLPTAY